MKRGAGQVPDPLIKKSSTKNLPGVLVWCRPCENRSCQGFPHVGSSCDLGPSPLVPVLDLRQQETTSLLGSPLSNKKSTMLPESFSQGLGSLGLRDPQL